MTDGPSDEKTVALPGVVDRVPSYQEASPEGTVERELREARDKTTDTVDVPEVLG